MLQQELFEHHSLDRSHLPVTEDRRFWYHALGSLGTLLPAEQGAGSIWDTSYTLQTRNKLTWAGSR